MFNRILIANRGEIACRIIKTLKNMGIYSIAIYSTADKDSEHVKQADSAYCVGEASATSSYLNIEAIIKAAVDSKADAIHPGYGFLSENPKFAAACVEANIVFIGPSIKAMEAMASKQLAKQLLEKTSVPLTPGYHGSDQSDERLLQAAKNIGFPVLLKAASGGGGKGMRTVLNEEDFSSSLAAARREAKASFADDTIIIEKFIVSPRHIEIQIMADNHGKVVHLFERDCSIQRRHQKIIEEAPAPHLSDILRENLAKAACEVARTIDYRGAGTVEFLLNQDEQFYFMEMNTRLQVEHPVTEMITGIDLVDWQIRIAADEPIPCEQEDIQRNGHAIECRIYAEDPWQNFIPSTGRIRFLKEPQGTGIRLDSGIKQGSDISMYYDPMIAKLIAWGSHRDEALKRLQRALDHYHIGGVKSNIPFLKGVCKNKSFIKGKLSTNFLSKEKIDLPHIDEEKALKIAAAYDYFKTFQNFDDPLYRDSFGWHMNLSNPWFWKYTIGQKYIELKITPLHSQRFKLTLNDQSFIYDIQYEKNQLTLDDGQQKLSADIEDLETILHIYDEMGQIMVEQYSWKSLDAHSGQQKGQLTSPMPATVVAILKNIGEAVKAGERLIVLEAMKMEHTIHAPSDGILTKLFYNVGSQVKEGAELLTLEEITPQE